jgi:hypothetical protein
MLHSGLLHVQAGVSSLEELERFFSADLEALH